MQSSFGLSAEEMCPAECVVLATAAFDHRFAAIEVKASEARVVSYLETSQSVLVQANRPVSHSGLGGALLDTD